MVVRGRKTRMAIDAIHKTIDTKIMETQMTDAHGTRHTHDVDITGTKTY